MTKIKGKLKRRARIMRGRTAEQHQVDTLTKMLDLPADFKPTKQELDEAFADAAQRREAERKEIEQARAEGRIYRVPDNDE